MTKERSQRAPTPQSVTIQTVSVRPAEMLTSAGLGEDSSTLHLVVFLLGQRYLIEGITVGGVKG
jgi:ABC-type glycerol-3-phosphate transport system permease component